MAILEQQAVSRRNIVGGGGVLALLAAAGVLPSAAMADRNQPAFDAKALTDAFAKLGATAKPADSADIKLIASDLAENGAVVPVQIISNIPGTTQIALLVEKNPFLLASVCDFGPETVPEISLRTKMGETSQVIALVKAGDKFYVATKEIKVTLGGCGG